MLRFTRRIAQLQPRSSKIGLHILSTRGGSTANAGSAGGTGGNTAIQDIITWTFSAAAKKTSIGYEAKNRSGNRSGSSVVTLYCSDFPDSTRILLRLGSPGNSITFTLNSNSPGSYDVKGFGEKDNFARPNATQPEWHKRPNARRRTCKLKGLYTIFDLRAISIANAGSQSFKLALTG